MKWLFLLALSSLSSTARAQNNVLVLLADDLGVDMLRMYDDIGANAPVTPHIDALAQRGVVFRTAWANPQCSPTRATILTGAYAVSSGIGDVIEAPGAVSLPASCVETLPELCTANGISSAWFGKWHLQKGQTPQDICAPVCTHGLTDFSGHLAPWSPPMGSGSCASWSKQSCTSTLCAGGSGMGTTTSSDDHEMAEAFSDALAWMLTAPEPWVCFLAPQAPYELPHDFDDCTACDPNLEACYEDMLVQLDELIGDLRSDLAAADLGDDQVTTFFVGDNGTPVNDTNFPTSVYNNTSGRRTKGDVYNPGVFVPLIVAGQAVADSYNSDPPTMLDELANTTDLYATIADILGLVPTTGATPHSESLYELLQASGNHVPRTYVFAEVFDRNFDPCVTQGQCPPNWNVERAISDGTWKLIRRTTVTAGSATSTQELYRIDDRSAAGDFQYELNDLLSSPPPPPPGTIGTAGAIPIAIFNSLQNQLNTLTVNCP